MRFFIAFLLIVSQALAQIPFNNASDNVTIRSGGPNPLWSPLDLGSALVAWYNASDATSITQSSGAVSQWSDKSGNGFHLVQATSGNKPTYSATGFQGNSPAITFDGTDDYLSASSATIGTNKLSAFCLAQFNEGSNLNLVGYQANGDAGPYSSNSVILFESLAGTSMRSYWHSTQGSVLPATSTPPPASSYLAGSGYYRMATVFDGTNNTMYLDNAYAATAVSYSGVLTTPGTILVGGRSGGSQPWSGPINEIIIMNRDATALERSKIDTFLLRKWTRVVVTEGDSTTAISATVPRAVQRFTANSSPIAYLDDIAIAGTDFWTNPGSCLIDRTASTDAHLSSDKRGRQYVLFFNFTNNLSGSPYTDPLTVQTPSSVAAGYVTYCSARKAAGWDKVVIGTAIPRTDGQANDTFRDALNAILRDPTWSGRTANGGPVDAICDYGADAIMGADASPTNNPTYWADGVHPNAAGFVRLETIFRSTINGL